MSTPASTITASAPGKVVLWGEYAVLMGAPALVMAVNRYATCRLEPSGTPGWQVSASGFHAAAATPGRRQLLDPDTAPGHPVWDVLWHVLCSLPSDQTANLPDRIRAHFDTGAFHQHGAKLGLGSSAALCVAVYGAVCRLLGRTRQLEEALAAHRRLQGSARGENQARGENHARGGSARGEENEARGKGENEAPGGVTAGSGIDVAAAWQGGTLRCQREQGSLVALPWKPPQELLVSCIWTGTSASTREHLARLRDWLAKGRGRELDDLGARTAGLFEADPCLEALADYVTALEALDRAAGLGIFSESHRRLGRLAIEAGVVYKPCGAGGGDVGAAFARSENAIERFNRLANAAGFLPLALETASHGIEVTG
ncbi:MAG: hypothetical protein RIC56_08255 [Pseudomonadales bacterium]